ncbi:DUF3850 domain-containing protein [Salmonella enterica subsp. enterica]|nr:DUF3850 domain-containing protein [Salmonella enterica subsp. enterica serovar Meleagridis]
MREVHTLKIWPEFFQPVLDGVKRAELRLNDRNYRAGDVLFLREFLPADDSYSGRYVSVTISSVDDVSAIAPGYVLLSFKTVLTMEGKFFPFCMTAEQARISVTDEKFLKELIACSMPESIPYALARRLLGEVNQ